MNSPFSTTELSRMQTTQVSAMMDTALHMGRSSTEDDYGQSVEAYTSRNSYACGFKPVNKEEALGGTEVTMIDARLRMSLEVESVIGNLDRLQITHRFGVAVDNPETFEIAGAPERGPSGLVYNLKRLTEGDAQNG